MSEQYTGETKETLDIDGTIIRTTLENLIGKSLRNIFIYT